MLVVKVFFWVLIPAVKPDQCHLQFLLSILGGVNNSLGVMEEVKVKSYLLKTAKWSVIEIKEDKGQKKGRC